MIKRRFTWKKNFHSCRFDFLCSFGLRFTKSNDRGHLMPEVSQLNDDEIDLFELFETL